MALTKIDDRGLKTPIDLLDNEKIRFGTENDLQLFHDGSDSYLSHNGTGDLYIDADGSQENINLRSKKNVSIYVEDKTELAVKCNESGAIELYYDAGTYSDPKLQTTSTGAEVNSTTDATLKIANSGDGTAKLTLHNTGSTNWNAEVEDGVFTIKTATDACLKAHEDAQLELFYNGSKKAYTASSGLVITNNNAPNLALNSTPVKLVLDNTSSHAWDHDEHCGAIIFKKHENIVAGITATHTRTGSSHTNEDGGIQIWTSPNANPTVPAQVWEFDSLGSFVGKDNHKIQLGDNQDFRIYYSGSNNILECRNSKELHINNAEATNLAKFIPGGAAELYFDGTSAGKKLETTATGVTVTGDVKLTAAGGINFANYGAEEDPNSALTGIYDNLLDDYEAGLWYPTLSHGTATWYNARYIKIGKLVQIWGRFAAPTDATSNTQVSVESLPFAVESNNAGGSCMCKHVNVVASCAYVNTYEQLQFYANNTANDWTYLKYNGMNAANTQVYFQASYRAVA